MNASIPIISGEAMVIECLDCSGMNSPIRVILRDCYCSIFHSGIYLRRDRAGGGLGVRASGARMNMELILMMFVSARGHLRKPENGLERSFLWPDLHCGY